MWIYFCKLLDCKKNDYYNSYSKIYLNIQIFAKLCCSLSQEVETEAQCLSYYFISIVLSLYFMHYNKGKILMP